MGWLSKLAHIGEAVGGVGLLAVTGGAAAPYAIPLIAGGAGGFVQDLAGDSAQKTLQKGTDAATAANNAALAKQQGLLNPYVAQGGASLQNLGSLMGGAPPQGMGAMVAPTGVTTPTGMADPRAVAMTGTPTGTTAVPRANFVTLPDGRTVPAGSLAALNQSSVRAN
jgi:hypothetical protein